jgi:hypothetical protein
MTITLNKLSQNELRIYNEAGYQQRHTGVEIVDTSNEWLYKDYKSIHNEYLSLFDQSSEIFIKIEALKRLIFLNWNFFVEDYYFTGIKELDEATIVSSYEILNDYIRDDRLDDELNWMLSFYSSWDYFIFQYSENKLNELTTFVKKVDTFKINYPKKALPKGIMGNRGQMGIYWKELVEKD